MNEQQCGECGITFFDTEFYDTCKECYERICAGVDLEIIVEFQEANDQVLAWGYAALDCYA